MFQLDTTFKKKIGYVGYVYAMYYSIAVITFYLLRPHKLTNENQSQIQSV
jgi:hypothetical protein